MGPLKKNLKCTSVVILFKILSYSGIYCPFPRVEHTESIPINTELHYEETLTLTCEDGYGINGDPNTDSMTVTCGSDRKLTPEFNCSGKDTDKFCLCPRQQLRSCVGIGKYTPKLKCLQYCLMFYSL